MPEGSRLDHRLVLQRWLREPLVHFLALGALLFALSHWRGGSGPGSSRIVVTPGQLDWMIARFARTWQRPPTEAELAGLVEDHVRDELASREAVALGLDRDDLVIRRRLRQKLEFLVEDSLEAAPVTDAQLRAWMEKDPGRFRFEPELAFRQVYLNPESRGASAERDARALLARLSAAGRPVAADVGDRIMLPSEVELSTRSSIARQFGERFADELLAIEPGRWAGPVRSGFGLHLVWVRERREGRMPALDEIRPVVEREFLSERRRQRIDEAYARLRSRYRVVVEPRRAPSPAAAGKSPTPAGGR